jgi:transcriptional regulator with XRE-family HTH domain
MTRYDRNTLVPRRRDTADTVSAVRMRKPARVVMHLAGDDYEVDLETVRRALARWRLTSEAQRAPVRSLAEATGLSRCTIWRFLSGRPVGLMAVKRVTQVLGLDPRQVARPLQHRTTPLSAIVEAARAVVEAGGEERAPQEGGLDARIEELAALLTPWSGDEVPPPPRDAGDWRTWFR